MQVVLMIVDAVISGFVWFTKLYTAAGLLDMLSGIIIISLIMSRLVSPLLRASGSDKASKSHRKDSSNG